MDRAYYSDSIASFLAASKSEIFGKINAAHTLASDPTQKGAWLEEIQILKQLLTIMRAESISNMRFREWENVLMSFY